MTAGPPSTPHKPHKPERQPTVAETLRAIEERSEARRGRSNARMLFYASAVVALVLAEIVLVNLNPPQPEPHAPPSPPVAATPTAAAPAADPIADRAFAATLDRLQAEGAASADARERTRAHRSQVQRAIDESGLELKIDRFECGPRMCAAWLLGASDAYERLNAALSATPQAPLRGIAGTVAPADSAPSDKLRHPLLLSIGTDADAAKTAPTAPP